MISVDEAIDTTIGAAKKTSPETVALTGAVKRVAARDVYSLVTQPPFRASAMDGYAVRFAEAQKGASLAVIGEAAAGRPFAGAISAGAAVRIFTGGAVPLGADHIVIQEDAERENDRIIVTDDQRRPAHIREAGIDFKKGDRLIRAGEALSAVDLGLIAAAGHASVEVYRKPVVAYFDNGDELREPGETLKAGEIYGSNRFALDAMIADFGGQPLYLGRAPDNDDGVSEKIRAAAGADILLTIGGASVGDHDFVRSSFAQSGGEIVFSKIAVRPGKPTWLGRLGDIRALGLPGNPASAIVCAMLFLKPLIAASAGQIRARPVFLTALLGGDMRANGPRDAFIRGRVSVTAAGALIAEANDAEDSSLFSPLADGNALIRRPANAPPAQAGSTVDVLVYDDFPA